MLLLVFNPQASSFTESEQNAFFGEESFREASEGKPATKRFGNPQQDINAYYAAQLDSSGIKLVPGTKHRRDSKPTAESSKRCKSIVYKTFMTLPRTHREVLDTLTLFYTDDGRRGLGGDGSIVLRCKNIGDKELAAVFIHEMGHLADGSLLMGFDYENESGFYDFDEPVLADDPSARFYAVSWKNESTMRSGTKKTDFVSGYAMSDPFEDFAETYAFYRLHGPEFRQLLATSDQLKEKYAFMRDEVFDGEEFELFSKPRQGGVNRWSRSYDVTVLPY